MSAPVPVSAWAEYTRLVLQPASAHSLAQIHQLLSSHPELLQGHNPAPTSATTGYHDTSVTAAVRANRPDVVQLLALREADLNQAMRNHPKGSPLILSLISHTEDGMFRTLIAHGADVKLLDQVLVQQNITPEDLSISHAYWLLRARSQPTCSREKLRIYSQLHLRRMPEIFLSLVGQQTACVSVERALLTHRITEPKKPFVLVFAGPPGHGQLAPGQASASWPSILSLIRADACFAL